LQQRSEMLFAEVASFDSSNERRRNTAHAILIVAEEEVRALLAGLSDLNRTDTVTHIIIMLGRATVDLTTLVHGDEAWAADGHRQFDELAAGLGK